MANGSKWDNPTVRLLILVVGILLILRTFATDFDITELKELALIAGIIAGDKYSLHKHLKKLLQGDPAAKPTKEEDEPEEEQPE